MLVLPKLPQKLIGYRLLVELQDVRKLTTVAIPEGSEFERTIGTVVMCGDGTLPPTCRNSFAVLPANLGDTVVLGDFGGGEVVIGQGEDLKKYRLVSGEDVLAILDYAAGGAGDLVCAGVGQELPGDGANPGERGLPE